MFNNVEKMTPNELIAELSRWHLCYRDAPNNFDARLIRRSIQIIEDLLSKVEDFEDLEKTRDSYRDGIMIVDMRD